MEATDVVYTMSIWGATYARVLGYRLLGAHLKDDMAVFEFEAGARQALTEFKDGFPQCDLHATIDAYTEIIVVVKKARGRPTW